MGKMLLAILCICFFTGAATHIHHNAVFGIFPYSFAPVWMNAYWTLLGLFDLLVVYLLIYKLRAGLILGLLIMFSDVAINSYAYYVLDILSDVLSLQLQSIFLGFTIASSIALWKWKV